MCIYRQQFGCYPIVTSYLLDFITNCPRKPNLQRKMAIIHDSVLARTQPEVIRIEEESKPGAVFHHAICNYCNGRFALFCDPDKPQPVANDVDANMVRQAWFVVGTCELCLDEVVEGESETRMYERACSRIEYECGKCLLSHAKDLIEEDDDERIFVCIFCKDMERRDKMMNSPARLPLTSHSLQGIENEFLRDDNSIFGGETPIRSVTSQDHEIDVDGATTAEVNQEEAALEPPPESEYPTLEAAEESIHEFTLKHGYAMVKTRSKPRKGELDDNGNPVVGKVWWECSQGGEYRTDVSETTRKRKISSRQKQCPFSAYTTFFKKSQTWKTVVRTREHNHGAMEAHAHSTHRNRALATRMNDVERLYRAGDKPSEIYSKLEQEGEESLFTLKDIQNVCEKMHRQFLNGLAPIQALVREVESKDEWIAEVERGPANEVRTLFFAHRSSLKLLERFPYILVGDCTYKTNRFNMPLLQFIGTTAMNRLFYVAWAFISNETQEGYQYAVRSLKSLYTRLNLEDPVTIFTDKDRAFRNSLATQFPDTNLLLCIWHINKNIVSRAMNFLRSQVENEVVDGLESQQQLKDALEQKRQSFLRVWNLVVNAETEEKYQEEWRRFVDLYGGADCLVEYIEDTYMCDKHCFLKLYTNRLFHLGQNTTSKAEGAHALIKRDLKSSRGNLLSVFESVARTVRRVNGGAEKALSAASINHPLQFSSALFSQVLGKVSPFALHLVNKSIEERQEETRDVGRRARQCKEVLRRTMGVPCAHELTETPALTPNDFHPQWHLYRMPNPSPPMEPRLVISEPAVSGTRGRPNGPSGRRRLDNRQDTRREPSNFEVQEDRAHRSLMQRGRARRANREAAGEVDGVPPEMTGIMRFD